MLVFKFFCITSVVTYGFFMKNLSLLLLVFAPLFGALPPLCEGQVQPKTPCAGWEALQQVGSLIPERIWDQEFKIKVARRSFLRAFDRWTGKKSKECAILGASREYFLRSAMAGENVRIADEYSEFQWSPFWKTFPMEKRLKEQVSLSVKERR